MNTYKRRRLKRKHGDDGDYTVGITDCVGCGGYNGLGGAFSAQGQLVGT